VATDIVMPHLSDSMEEGTILQWLVDEGTPVKEGEPLVEVETDKASVTYEAEQDGVLLMIAVGVGESAPVGSVIAVIGEPGETVQRSASSAASPANAAASAAVEGATARSAGYGAPEPELTLAPPPGHGNGNGTAPGPPAGGRAESRNGETAASPSPSGDRVKASPLARRIAGELGVKLAGLAGTGPQGRIVRADVERAAGTPASVTAPGAGEPAASPSSGTDAVATARPPAEAKGDTTRRELSRLQQTVARRMAESRATVPDFELRVEVDMSAAVTLREQLRNVAERPPSFNDFIVKAAALALREFPRVNGAYRDGAFEEYSRVNVGIAVAAADALVVPTIFDADEKSLGTIASTSRSLAARVRDGSITPGELSGGTFSVSNLGMYGIDSFSAVVNAPQAAILAVGSLRQRPVVDGSDPAQAKIVARPTVNLTLACDHRILYGADGARFLDRLRELLQAPLALLVG
jgi:pyruvate dehydrogenase E2 component (dihydrolipoamide acetyltransferase)